MSGFDQQAIWNLGVAVSREPLLSLFSLGWLQGSKVKGFAVSWEPIPDFLPNVTVILPVAARTTPSSNPALDKLWKDTSSIQNLTVGCGSYREYYGQLKAALKRLGYEENLKPLNLTLHDLYPDIVRELITVAPGHQKPVLPQTGPRLLAADLLNTIAEPYFTLLQDSICEPTPRLLEARDAWLNISSASVQRLAVDFNISNAWRSIEEARSNHNIVSFVSLSYQAVAAKVGLQLGIKLFPDAPKRYQNVVKLETVEDGYSKHVTLSPSMIRRLDGSEVSAAGCSIALTLHAKLQLHASYDGWNDGVFSNFLKYACTCKYLRLTVSNAVQDIVVEASIANTANALQMLIDELTVSVDDIVLNATLASGPVDSVSATTESSALTSIYSAPNIPQPGTEGSNDTSQSDLASLLTTVLDPPTHAFMLFSLDPNGIQVTTEMSLSTIEITSQVSQQPCLSHHGRLETLSWLADAYTGKC